MKFAKELEEDLVPEWRVKYLNYKLGKKKIKAVSRALRNANRTPKLGERSAKDTPSAERLPFTHYDFSQRDNRPTSDIEPLFPARPDPKHHPHRPPAAKSKTMFTKSPPAFMPDTSPEPAETQPLNVPQRHPERRMRYGSIVATPPDHDPPPVLPRLELPDPAMEPSKGKGILNPTAAAASDSTSPLPTKVKQSAENSDAYHVGPQHPPHKSLHRTIFHHHKSHSYHSPKPTNTYTRSKIRRMFSATAALPELNDVRLAGYRELDAQQDDFFNFLDKELEKIESFYKMKEREASHRLDILRSQLHEMRDRRVEELNALKQHEQGHHGGLLEGILPEAALKDHTIKIGPNANFHGPSFLKPIENAVRRKSHHVGKTDSAMDKLGSPTAPEARRPDDNKDYVRKEHANEKVPYKFAKRRLKLAMQEFYRALELLKSYALLNRTGFRKMNKKYDKAVNARPTGRYMSEKVNNAHFVQSNIIEGHLVAVEDLYARYFERGNHKIAVNKLRSKLKPGDQSSSAFRNGIFLAAGIVFAMDGLVRAFSDQRHIYHPDAAIQTQANYLLQIYAAYFLALLLFLLFVLDCKIWTAARINYIFIFEYDTRHVLDWRQLAELPCFFLFLNGLFLWLNFRLPEPDAMYIYWPIVLCGLTLVIMGLPFPILYSHARKWWGFSNWRLLLAGIYPVEFRDFYLGDMYCSETYAMSQIEVFFCLYAHHWKDPPQCNSNHSRLLGFFTTIPAIWRALQCLRRYHDSGNWFPHLANFAKYMGNIIYYMTLSLYRIQMNDQMRAVFITFAAINGIYSSIWDIFLDFSLGNPFADHPFLRDRLAYRRVWVYYVAIILDVVLRQQWILYAVFQRDLQHAAILSFFIGLAEVLRRGMWSLFRVENEHCNNVGKFRASRDIALPYNVAEPAEHEDEDIPSDAGTRKDPLRQDPHSTGVDVEHAPKSPESPHSGLRLRKSRSRTPGSTPGIRALHRVGTVIAAAHAQDFEKKKRPEIDGHPSPESSGMHQNDDSSDEDEEDRMQTNTSEEDDEDDVMNAQKLLSRGQG